MNDPMTLERFAALADAYGGVVARWPEPARDAASHLATQPAASAMLREASALDAILDAWTVPSPSPALRHRVMAAAPVPARDPILRARLWWSGVGIAAALAGAATGTAAIAIMPPVDSMTGASTSFGDVSPKGS